MAKVHGFATAFAPADDLSKWTIEKAILSI